MPHYSSVRVRFAPSPSGMMHLGNVRTALMNYLFAKKYNGDFVIRVEDTDPERNFDPHAIKIIDDLLWLNLDYNEGPIKGGPYAPYFQSERHSLYQEKLAILDAKGLAYRCFCTLEDLEKKRQRQKILKLPPRYDRTCAQLNKKEIDDLLEQKKEYIWRFKFDLEKSISINDLARGTIVFELKNFSDFPLTRKDGTFTFMFANCVDDIMMCISHVLRGEDHLTNTVGQAALYNAFDIELPFFWHLPIIGNQEGRKLSKRDFGFSLNDLRTAGFLPEAINNYLALIGGGSFDNEIMSLDELTKELNFETISSTGQIRYDVEKLRWINHKWIERLSPEELAQRCLVFLEKVYPEAQSLDEKKIISLTQAIRSDLTTLVDSVEELSFYFNPPVLEADSGTRYIDANYLPLIKELITKHSSLIETSADDFINTLKSEAKTHSIPLKYIFSFIRVALTGKPNGLSIHQLLEILSPLEILMRFKKGTIL